MYSADEIGALVTAAGRLARPVSAATYPALIGLLAATGARVGELLALDDGDFDAGDGVLTVRNGKSGKQRLLPLHPTATAALVRYQQERDRLLPARAGDAAARLLRRHEAGLLPGPEGVPPHRRRAPGSRPGRRPAVREFMI